MGVDEQETVEDEGSPEEAELRRLSDVIHAHEAKRWPSGKVTGGKG